MPQELQRLMEPHLADEGYCTCGFPLPLSWKKRSGSSSSSERLSLLSGSDGERDSNRHHLSFCLSACRVSKKNSQLSQK